MFRLQADQQIGTTCSEGANRRLAGLRGPGGPDHHRVLGRTQIVVLLLGKPLVLCSAQEASWSYFRLTIRFQMPCNGLGKPLNSQTIEAPKPNLIFRWCPSHRVPRNFLNRLPLVRLTEVPIDGFAVARAPKLCRQHQVVKRRP